MIFACFQQPLMLTTKGYSVALVYTFQNIKLVTRYTLDTRTTSRTDGVWNSSDLRASLWKQSLSIWPHLCNLLTVQLLSSARSFLIQNRSSVSNRSMFLFQKCILNVSTWHCTSLRIPMRKRCDNGPPKSLEIIFVFFVFIFSQCASSWLSQNPGIKPLLISQICWDTVY